MKTRKNFSRILFLHYSYLISIAHDIADLMPPIIRFLIFKLVLRKMGKNVFIDTKVYFRYPGKVSIGNSVSVNRGCEFYPSFYHKDAIIILGNNIRIGPGVKFLAAGHDHTKLNLPDTAGKIQIKNNVLIGANCSILQGVTIEEGAIIAAGSIVSKSVPKYKIYGGVPAKEIKERDIIES